MSLQKDRINKSPECIVPSAFDRDERQQSAKVGIFNLISTMIGGGVLSLPFAISRSGLIIGFFMLTLSAIASVFSFDILVSSSRRTGAMTYQQIGYFAFGPKIQHIITFLIWCLTWLASIAYCVLVGDLIKPIICYLGGISDTDCSAEWLRRVVIAGGILFVSPFCYMRQIKALKYTSIISIASVVILAAIIAMKTAIHFGDLHTIYYMDNNGVKHSYQLTTDIHLFPQSANDVIYAFPVFFLSFMCHFNIPQVHSELTRPTRRRMRIILITVVAACYVLYATVAFFGYFYSFGYTCGNILLNYNQNDPMITLARLCLGFVILFTFPLLILPARGSMHNLLNLVLKSKSMNMEDIEDTVSTFSDSRSEISLLSGQDGNEPIKHQLSSLKNVLEAQNQEIRHQENDNDNALHQSLMGASADLNDNDDLFGADNDRNYKDKVKNDKNEQNKTKVKDGNDGMTEDEENVIIANINKQVVKLQVVKTNPTSSQNIFGPIDNTGSKERVHSPSPYSMRSRSIQQPRTPIAYNTFNTNPSSVPNNRITNNSATNKLLNKKPKIYDNGKKSPPHSGKKLMSIFHRKSNEDNHSNREESISSKGTERSVRSVSTTKGFMTRSFSRIDSPLRVPQDALGVINEPKDALSLKDKEFLKSFKDLEGAKNFTPTNLWLIGETTLMIGLSLLVSFLTESVMVLWGIVGSTVTFIIAFALPGMFYLRIRRHKGWTWRNISSGIITTVSTIAIVLCTWQAMLNLDAPPCPNQPPSHIQYSS